VLCKNAEITHRFLQMNYSAIWISIVAAPLLTQCTSLTTPSANAVTGPFDSRGNYVEAWADSPDKWFRPSNPVSSPSVRPPAPTFVEKPFVNTPTTRPSVTTPPIIQKPISPPQIVTVQPKPKVTAPAVVKAKPKPKPAVVRYTIKRGDTLSRIASNQGVSLTALRRANKISGDMIHPGRTLTIPK
jgi:LysM repeat protein